MGRKRTESIWIGAHRFDYQDGNKFIAIWPHDEGKAAGWIIKRTNCDDASVAVVASARRRFGLVETPTPVNHTEPKKEQTTL